MAGRIPEARYGHTLTEINSKHLLLLGGSNQVEFSNELYLFSRGMNEWRLLHEFDDVPATPIQYGAPAPRTPPTQLQPPPNRIQKRHFHTAVFRKGMLYTFGGKSNGYWQG